MKRIKKIINIYLDIFSSLSKDLKINFFRLMFFNIFIGLIDTLGVLSIAPLIAVLTNSEILNSNFLFIFLKKNLNLKTNESLIIFFSIFTLCMFILSFVGKTTQKYINLKYSNNIYFYYSNNLFKYFLNRDYLFHTQNSSYELVNNIYTDTQRLQSRLLNPMLEICSNIIILFFLFFSLIFVDYYLTILFTIFFLLFYLIYIII